MVLVRVVMVFRAVVVRAVVVVKATGAELSYNIPGKLDRIDLTLGAQIWLLNPLL